MGVKARQLRKLTGKKLIHLKCVSEGELYQKETQVDPRSNEMCNPFRRKNWETEAVVLWAHQDLLAETITLRKLEATGGRSKKRWSDSFKKLQS